MIANIITSRAICQDPFYKREEDRRYKLHQKNITQISKKQHHPSLQHLPSAHKTIQTFHKSKSSAKKFKQIEEQKLIQKNNEILAKKMLQLKKEKQNNNHVMYKSGSNWTYRKKQASTIRKQNQRFAESLKGKTMKPPIFIERMNKDIREYLSLRKHVRKFRQTSTPRTDNNNIVSLKLHTQKDDKDEKDNKEEKDYNIQKLDESEKIEGSHLENKNSAQESTTVMKEKEVEENKSRKNEESKK